MCSVAPALVCLPPVAVVACRLSSISGRLVLVLVALCDVEFNSSSMINPQQRYLSSHNELKWM